MNIFLRELRANRKSLIIWSVCMFLLILSGMGKYTAYSTGGANAEVFDKMPFTLKAFLGIGSFDVTTMSGFFAFLFTYISVTAAIHAVLLGSGIISKEERDKTTEFLMVKPVHRNTVITSKFLAALFNIAVINIVSLFSSIAAVSAYNKDKDITGEIVVFMLSMFIIQLIFLSLGAFLAAIMKRSKGSGSIAAGLLIGAYLISKITDVTDKLNVLNLLSPFKYFSLPDIVAGKGLSLAAVTLSVLLAIALTAASYFFYGKRDLSV